MSTGIIPEIYRYTARKSTVSKNPKQNTVSSCNNSTTLYATCNNDHTSKPKQQTPKLDTLDYHIKIENDSTSFQSESFIILHDNETEQMAVDENNEQTNEDIIREILDKLQNDIESLPKPILPSSNQIENFFSIDTQDVHYVVDSIVNRVSENVNEKSPNNAEQNVNTISNEITPMESDQSVSIISQSQIDDDILEIQETNNNVNSHFCTCQCHKPTSPLENEYFLFEQALKQARLDQQNERSLANNRLIQTLKRQHEELMNIYQQNKLQKPSNITKLDREQQTVKLHQLDSQVQTDSAAPNNSKISPKQQKNLILPTMNSHVVNNHVPLTATRNHNAVYNSNSTPSTSSLQHIIPRLSANAVATTTIATKTSMITTKAATITNKISTTTVKPTIVANPPPLSSPLQSSTNSSHDVVDLTEEDEDDNTNRTAAQRATATRQSASFIQPPTTTPLATTTTTASASATATVAATTTATTAATTSATRIRPINRTIRSNNPVINGQIFPLRPLPEHQPSDHTIARPQLNITQENATVRLTWNLPSTPMESIQNYEIYAYKQNASVTTSDWKKIGTVKSMRLPMAVTLKEFQSNSHYAFAVRAVSINNSIGPFCEPKTIFTGNTPVQPLHTSQLLNVST